MFNKEQEVLNTLGAEKILALQWVRDKHLKDSRVYHMCEILRVQWSGIFWDLFSKLKSELLKLKTYKNRDAQ